jgi:HAD superfamily hydrolase (TIGR01549 family)
VLRGAPLIFDLDDTLIESFPTYVRLHQRVAEELALPVPTRAQLVPYGRTWEETLTALWPGLNLARFVERYDAVAEDHPYPAVAGASDMLSALRAEGHALFIGTKRSRRRLMIRLQQASLDARLFDGIFAAEDQPATKPDPRCFEPVWDTLGGVPRATLYVGDRFEDRHAAEGAGVRFLAVMTGPEVELGFPGDLPATCVLPSVAAVPAWLRQHGYDP